MIKKTLTYKDYDGNEVTEDWYFNFNMDELIDLQLEEDIAGQFQGVLDAIKDDNPKDENKIRNDAVRLIKKFSQGAVGRKSEDGKRFIKNDQILSDFTETGAYSAFFLDLMGDPDGAAKFITGLVDADAIAKLEKMKAAQAGKVVELPTADVPIEKPKDDKPWITENREPTKAELASMSREDLIEVMKRKNS